MFEILARHYHKLFDAEAQSLRNKLEKAKDNIWSEVEDIETKLGLAEVQYGGKSGTLPYKSTEAVCASLTKMALFLEKTIQGRPGRREQEAASEELLEDIDL